MSGKYSTRLIWVLCLSRDTMPSAIFYHTTQEYSAFTQLFIFVCENWLPPLLTWVWENGFAKMLNKVTESIVSLLLLSIRLEINDARVLWCKLIYSVWLSLIKDLYCIVKIKDYPYFSKQKNKKVWRACITQQYQYCRQ